jgi:hypothetical protein
MFIRLHYQKLKDDMRARRIQLFFPFYNIGSTFQYLLQIALFSILFIDFLSGTIYGYDESVQSGFYGSAGIIIIQKVSVGGGYGINFFLGSILHHNQKIGIDIRLTLKVKNKIHQLVAQFVKALPEEILFKIAGGATEGTKSGGAFGASQIASGSWLEGDCHGQPPLCGF